MPLSREHAEAIGLKALAWLLSDDALYPIFMGRTGASEHDLRAGAGDPGFLGSVLDFVMMDDDWVIAFCDTKGIAYQTPMEARRMLPGGEQVHWT